MPTAALSKMAWSRSSLSRRASSACLQGSPPVCYAQNGANLARWFICRVGIDLKPVSLPGWPLVYLVNQHQQSCTGWFTR
jgi:hypothetical protein